MICRNSKTTALIILSLIVFILTAFLLRFFLVTPGCELDVDVFYHIRMADMFPESCLTTHFPWTQLSIWRDSFYDKELGFHALLHLFRLFSCETGLSWLPPFHFISICLATLVTAVYSIVSLRYNRDYSFLVPLLFIVISPLFLLRLDMIRPQVISILLFGVALHVACSDSRPRWKALILFSLSWMYTLCYSSPQVVFIAIFSWISADLILRGCKEINFTFAKNPGGWIRNASPERISIREGRSNKEDKPQDSWPERLAFFRSLIAALARYIFFRKAAKFRQYLFILAAAAAGIVAGLALHPQAPGTFFGWYVQGVMVISRILHAGANVDLGNETGGASFHTAAENSGLFIVYLAALFLYFYSKRKRSRSEEPESSTQAVTFLIAGGIMIAGFFFSERCIEYAVPSTVLAFVSALSLNNGLLKNTNRIFMVICSYVVFMLATIFYTLPVLRENIRGAEMSPCYGFGVWAADHIRPGTYIGHIRWGEFPRLFYVAPQLKYSMAMDPMFTYAVYPEKAAELNDFVFMRKQLSPKQLKQILGTNLVFISTYDRLPADSLIRSGAKILYSGADGWLLQL